MKFSGYLSERFDLIGTNTGLVGIEIDGAQFHLLGDGLIDLNRFCFDLFHLSGEGFLFRQLHTEVDSVQLSRRNTVNTRIFCRKPGAFRQGCGINFEDDIFASSPETAAFDIGEVVSTESIGFDQHTRCRGDAHSRNTLFTLILNAVGIGIFKHFSDYDGIVRERVGGDDYIGAASVTDDFTVLYGDGGVGVSARCDGDTHFEQVGNCRTFMRFEYKSAEEHFFVPSCLKFACCICIVDTRRTFLIDKTCRKGIFHGEVCIGIGVVDIFHRDRIRNESADMCLFFSCAFGQQNILWRGCQLFKILPGNISQIVQWNIDGDFMILVAVCVAEWFIARFLFDFDGITFARFQSAETVSSVGIGCGCLYDVSVFVQKYQLRTRKYGIDSFVAVGIDFDGT